MSHSKPEMPAFTRRGFLRRAATLAGVLTATGAATTQLTGCCDPPPAATALPAPNPPSGLSATAVSSTQIDLTWIDNAEDETGFEVERAGPDGIFQRVAALGSDALVYPDTGLSGGTSYSYRVRAVSENGPSDYSNTTAAATFPTPVGAPAAPTLLAGAGLTSTGLTLSWVDNATDETAYRVEFRDPDGEFGTLATLPRGATSLVVTGLTGDRRYEYRVRAVNELGASDPSNVLRIRTGAVIEALSVVADGTPGRLLVGWTDLTAGTVIFRVERRVGSGDFATAGAVTLGKREFVDTALVPGVEHAYRVSAEGELSLDAAPVAISVPKLPAAPLGFRVENDPADGSRLLVSWAPGDLAASRFHLERKGPLESFTERTLTPDALATNFIDSGGSPLTPYDYRVRSSNLAGYSPYTDTVTGQQRAVFASGSSTLSGTIAGVLATIGKGAAVRINRSAIELGSGCRQNSNPTRVWLIRKSATEVTAVMAHCTHACLTVPSFNWQEANSQFICAHGSRFDVDGQILQEAISGSNQGSVPTLRAELFPERIEVFR